MRETTAHEIELPVRALWMLAACRGRLDLTDVLFQDVSYSAFMKMLEFIYTDDVGELPFNTAVDLLIVAEQFLLDRLKGICEDKIRRGIAMENVINICITAHQLQATSLKVNNSKSPMEDVELN